MDTPTERCVGCGALVARISGPTHRYMLSAPGCWALYGELLAQLLSDSSTENMRRRAADAFAVQHPGVPGPQAIQSVALHLISLHAQHVLGRSPIEAHSVIESGVRAKPAFRWLTPPSSMGPITVAHVLDRRASTEKTTADWAREAWQAWEPWHAQIRDWHRDLDDTRASRARRYHPR